jgi:uncharacterized protein YecA (UPF0149 family)
MLSWKGKILAAVLFWILGLVLKFGAVFFALAVLFLVFSSLGKRVGGLSAYSVFNPNFERIEGTSDAAEYQSSMMYGMAGAVAGAGQRRQLHDEVETLLRAPPKKHGVNDPCWCGSGRKYKKCCLGAKQVVDDDSD